MTSGETLRILLHRAERRGWAGADPYDGLLSGAGRAVIPLGFAPRFALSQLVLRSGSARRALNPPSSVSPKALGLFLGAAVRAVEALPVGESTRLADDLVAALGRCGVRTANGMGWGYPFPWQSRSFWAPAGTPNAVVTATVGWHLLDAAERLSNVEAQRVGIAAADFLARDLRRTGANEGVALSYTAADQTRVVNISALGARLLARASRVRGDEAAAALAHSLTRFVLAAQRADGSWPYAADHGGEWEDSFHTGYVIESLLDLRESGMPVPDAAIARGLSAYGRYFAADGAARLWPNRDDVLDGHSAAQGVLTYAAVAGSSFGSSAIRDEAAEKSSRIARWAQERLWVTDPGYFAYRIVRGRRDEREFMRWVSAWMALAMAADAARGAARVVAPSPDVAVGVA